MKEVKDTKILVVDDNPIWGFLIQQMLEFDRHQVMWAGDGAAGYGTYLLFKPDLVITDIEMPEKNGLEMMACVRAHNPAIGTIYISVDLDRFRPRLEEERKRYQVGCLQKPFSRRDLMKLVSEHGCNGEGRREENG